MVNPSILPHFSAANLPSCYIAKKLSANGRILGSRCDSPILTASGLHLTARNLNFHSVRADPRPVNLPCRVRSWWQDHIHFAPTCYSLINIKWLSCQYRVCPGGSCAHQLLHQTELTFMQLTALSIFHRVSENRLVQLSETRAY